MKWLRPIVQRNLRALAVILIAFGLVSFLMFYKLGTLVGGLNIKEMVAAQQVVGFSGIASNPLYLPLKIVRSVVFALVPDHGQTLTRLPNAFFGIVAVFSFAWLIQLWHGTRTALLAGLLFGASAWTLHVSRIATFDVVYFAALPLLLLGYALLKKYGKHSIVLYKVVGASCVLLYVPGLIWFILPTLLVERKHLVKAWQYHTALWKRITIGLIPIVLLMPLVFKLATDTALLKTWVGLPNQFASLGEIAKQLVAVPVHLFVRGPQYPELWLGRMPILDIFVLVLTGVGLYFYGKHLSSTRSRLLLTYALIGTVLVALGGPVVLSILVPLAFIMAAMGITYLLHEWFKVFPNNPIPRTIGVTMMTIAVLLSCTLGTRAYFVAWPHNETTAPAFRYHR